MGYKDVSEMINQIKNYAELFKYDIPEKFPVHFDYLIDNINELEFCASYKIYQKIMYDLQLNMANAPVEYGIITYDKKGSEKPAYSMNNQYIWLFLALTQSGKIENDILYIDKLKFDEFKKGKAVGKNVSSPKNVDKLLNRLKSHSFVINGDINDNFSVTSDIPNMMKIIYASTLTKYAKISMTSDYPSFNYRMYNFGIDEKLPFEETFTYSIMSDEQKEFSSELIKGLSEQGWKSYIFFPHSSLGGRLTYPTLEYYYYTNGGHILIRNDKKTLKLKPYMESLPEKYAVLWEASTKCRGCKKGECTRRIYGESFFGKKAVLCDSSKAVYSCNKEDVPYIIEAAMITAGKI